MIRLALAALLFTSASPVTDLVPAQVKSLKLRVPGVWKHSTEDGTETYTSPAKDAQVLVDVGATATPMDGGTCLNKILTAMGQEGWSRISLGGQPAAKKVAHDQSEDKQTEVETVMVVGCNGKTTFSLQFRIDSHKTDKYLPLVDAVSQSVTYLR
jgi:hypothetical protein